MNCLVMIKNCLYDLLHFVYVLISMFCDVNILDS